MSESVRRLSDTWSRSINVVVQPIIAELRGSACVHERVPAIFRMHILLRDRGGETG